jgi:hypothetical protein
MLKDSLVGGGSPLFACAPVLASYRDHIKIRPCLSQSGIHLPCLPTVAFDVSCRSITSYFLELTHKLGSHHGFKNQ